MEGESEWMSSSEEADRSPDQTAADDVGMGRSYECVFCKRGFTTAQALGGHMNIHRKDRATNKPTSRPSAGKADHDDNNNYHYYNSLQYPAHGYPLQHYPTRPAAHEVNINNNSYHAFFPAPMPPAYLDLFGEESWGGRRNMLPAAADRIHQNRDKESGVGGGGEGGLDLELRLGHDRRY